MLDFGKALHMSEAKQVLFIFFQDKLSLEARGTATIQYLDVYVFLKISYQKKTFSLHIDITFALVLEILNIKTSNFIYH